jgi:hypothetical protein
LTVFESTPCDLQGSARGDDVLEAVRDDGDAPLERDRADDAGQGRDLGLVPALRLGELDRRMHRRGIDHAGKLDVDGVLCAAVHLLRDVVALDRLADQAELRLLFQLALRDIRHPRRQLRKGGDLAVAHAPIRRGMNDNAGLGRELGRADAPFPRRRLHEDLADLRPDEAHLTVIHSHREAAVNAHAFAAAALIAVDLGLGRRHLQGHRLPIGIHLLGERHRHAGHGALSHLGRRRDDGDPVVGGNAHPGADLVPDRLGLGLR